MRPRFLFRSLLALRRTAFMLHLRPPILGRRRRDEARAEAGLRWPRWAAGEEVATAEPDSPSAADMPEPVCPSRLVDFFLEDLPPPMAVRACSRASSSVEATRRIVRPGSSFLMERCWCRTTQPLSAGSRVISGCSGGAGWSIMADGSLSSPGARTRRDARWRLRGRRRIDRADGLQENGTPCAGSQGGWRRIVQARWSSIWGGRCWTSRLSLRAGDGARGRIAQAGVGREKRSQHQWETTQLVPPSLILPRHRPH